MKVRDLIEALKTCDAAAEVILQKDAEGKVICFLHYSVDEKTAKNIVDLWTALKTTRKEDE